MFSTIEKLHILKIHNKKKKVNEPVYNGARVWERLAPRKTHRERKNAPWVPDFKGGPGGGARGSRGG